MSVVDRCRTLEGLELEIKWPGLEMTCVTCAHSSNI